MLIELNMMNSYIHRKLFLNSVNRGLSDIESGNIYSTKELKEKLKNRRSARNSKAIFLKSTIGQQAVGQLRNVCCKK